MLLPISPIRAAIRVAVVCAVAQLAACATPYSLPVHVMTEVGRPPVLACADFERQLCRDAGTALECRCAAY